MSSAQLCCFSVRRLFLSQGKYRLKTGASSFDAHDAPVEMLQMKIWKIPCHMSLRVVLLCSKSVPVRILPTGRMWMAC